MIRRRRRLGLRARITFIYALGALLLSAMVAAGAFTITRARLLNEFEQAAVAQGESNAIDLRQRLTAIPPELLEPIDDEDAQLETGESQERASDSSIDLGDLDPAENSSATPETTGTTALQPPVNIEEAREALEGLNGPGTGEQPTVPTSETPEPAEGDDAAESNNSNDGTSAETESDDPVTVVLEDLTSPNGAVSLLHLNGRDRSLAGLRETELPGGLRQFVGNGRPARQRVVLDGQTRLVVGFPIVGLDARYYEVASLEDLENTLNSLQVILAGTALAASLAGAALGRYSARRALQPLADVSAAAESIALGRFETRLDDHADPDLAGLTSSFNDMVDALRTRVERDGRFASDVSHELRSPLMTLAASVGVLQGRRPDLPPSAQKAVDLLSQDVHRFERLVEDLLEISRMDVGAIELDLTPIFLREFLEFVVSQSRSPEVPVRYKPADENLVISADKRRLGQAVTNLLDNAVKYAGTANGVTFRQFDDRVRIFVDDLGPGVRPEDRQRIFDRFTRAGGDAGRRGSTSGVGLGLSLVAEHIKLHDGIVSVTERPDGKSGARFVIDLPIGEQFEHDEEMAV